MPGLFRRPPQPLQRVRSYAVQEASPPLVFWACGYECRVGAEGYLGAETNSIKHWTSVINATVVSSPVRTGSYAGRFATTTTSGSAQASIMDGLTDGFSNAVKTRYYYARGYFRFGTNPSSITNTNWLMLFGDDTAGAYAGIRIQLTTGNVEVHSFGTASTTNDFVPAIDTWYGIEMLIDVATKTTKWRRWSSAGGWTTVESVTGGGVAHVSNTYFVHGIGIGGGGSGVAGTTVYWDDLAFGYGPQAYKLMDLSGTNGKDGYVLAYRPGADGTHGFNAAGDFDKNGADASPSDTDLYSYLDTSDITAATDNIAVVTAADGEFITVAFPDESSGYDNPRHASLVTRLGSSGTGDIAIDVTTDGSAWSRILDWVNLPSASDHYVRRPIKDATITKAEVDALQARIYARGQAWTLYGALLEVEWTSFTEPSADNPMPYVGGGYYHT